MTCSHPITFVGAKEHIFCNMCFRDLTIDKSIEEVEKKMRDDYDVPTYAAKENPVGRDKTLHEIVDEKLDIISKVFKDLKGKYDELEEVIMSLDTKTDDLEDQFRSLEERVDDMEDATNKIEDLETQLEDLKETLRGV